MAPKAVAVCLKGLYLLPNVTSYSLDTQVGQYKPFNVFLSGVSPWYSHEDKRLGMNCEHLTDEHEQRHYIQNQSRPKKHKQTKNNSYGFFWKYKQE